MDWLADEEEQGKRLGDRTIANAVIPLRAALATAKREGLIRHNPAQGLAMPHREQLPRRRRSRFSEPDQDSTAPAFPSEAGGSLDPSNLRRRVLKPLAEEVGAPWVGFHTFRHTFASLHLSQGTNLLQLSRALGHHSPAFTLTRYTHLLPGDEAPRVST